MAILNFPASPSINETYTENGVTYVWTGTYWTANTEAFNDVYVNIGGDTMTGGLNLPSLVASGDIQSTSQNGGQLAGFRNLLINGDFNTSQRGNSFSSLSGTVYTADRWKMGNQSATATAIRKGEDNSQPFRRSMELVDSSLQQGVELVADGAAYPFFVGTTWTLSCWATNDITANSSIAIFRDTVGVVTNQVVAATVPSWTATGETKGNFTRYSLTFTISGTPGATNKSFNISVPPQTGRVTGVQLEAGPVATPFEHRPYGTELALCQRYFYVGGRLGLDLATTSGSVKRANYFYPTQMRATPTIANLSTGDGSITNPVNSSKGGYFKTTGSSATTDGSISTDWTAEAEL